MLCQECSLKSECTQPCVNVEQYLKEKRNYKTTYNNKEVGLSIIALEQQSVAEYKDGHRLGEHTRENPDHVMWMKIVRITNECLTPKQRDIMHMYCEGLAMAEIGRRLGITGQAVKSAIFGHPKHGGGAVRRIRKELGINPTGSR